MRVKPVNILVIAVTLPAAILVCHGRDIPMPGSPSTAQTKYARLSAANGTRVAAVHHAARPLARAGRKRQARASNIS